MIRHQFLLLACEESKGLDYQTTNPGFEMLPQSCQNWQSLQSFHHSLARHWPLRKDHRCPPHR